MDKRDSWLECETSGIGTEKVVEILKCKVCILFKSKIETRRNYSDRWIIGASSVHTSNIRDHAHSDQRIHSVMLLRESLARSRGMDASAYTPIGSALNQISERVI